jgi:hypothetical protein
VWHCREVLAAVAVRTQENAEVIEMKTSTKWFSFLFLGLFLAFHILPAASRNTSPPITSHRQIVVVVYETDKGLRFKLQAGIYKDAEYKKYDANYFLADLKREQGGDCQIIEVVDDRAPLSAITEVSEMAINAGFKDIRPFIYWHKTGRMAQVQFGPPIKFSMNPEKIDRRVENPN